MSDYPKLSNVISAFYNSGQAGRQHRSYYTEGLLNNVLCGIKPGDVVSISGMGTNDTSSTKDEFKEYNNIYIDAIKAMGAKVILAVTHRQVITAQLKTRFMTQIMYCSKV